MPYAELEAAHPVGRDGILDLGGQGPVARIVCGKFDYDHDASQHPVLSALPTVIHVPGMSADPELQAIIRLLGEAVGYTSEFTFSRAFTRERGLPPRPLPQRSNRTAPET